jgi:hypothetical protein
LKKIGGLFLIIINVTLLARLFFIGHSCFRMPRRSESPSVCFFPTANGSENLADDSELENANGTIVKTRTRRTIDSTMSLSDLQQQIQVATLVTEKLENDAKEKGGFSRVRSSIRKEFSAFKKVLEKSKSRLQELESMQNDLKALEEPAAPELVDAPEHQVSVPPKPSPKSPHWLPALGRAKKAQKVEKVSKTKAASPVYLVHIFIQLSGL